MILKYPYFTGIIYGRESQHHGHLSQVSTRGGAEVVDPNVARVSSTLTVPLNDGSVRLDVADNWLQLNLRRIADAAKTT